MGAGGADVADWAIRLAQQAAQEHNWLLEKIALGRWQDLEFKDWQKAELKLVFRATQGDARTYWKAYLKEVGERRHRDLTEAQQDTLSNLVYDYAAI